MIIGLQFKSQLIQIHFYLNIIIVYFAIYFHTYETQRKMFNFELGL